jgi:hypothetical protein
MVLFDNENRKEYWIELKTFGNFLKVAKSYFLPFPKQSLICTLIKKDKVLTIAIYQVATKEGFAFSETFLEKTIHRAFATGVFHFNHLVLYIPPAR